MSGRLIIAIVVVVLAVAISATGRRRIALRRNAESAQNRLAYVRSARVQHRQLSGNRTDDDDDIDIDLVDSVIHEFLAEVQVGDPGQVVHVVFDTGSSEIWMSSSLCDDDTCMLEDHRFDPKLSRTFIGTDRKESCVYGSGEVQGRIGYDQIQIASGVVVGHQSMGLIESQDGSVFEAGVLDGIVGMSLAGLSTFQDKEDFKQNLPLIYNMRSQGLLPNGQFAFYFSRDESRRPSELIFGAVDPTLYAGPMRWVDVAGEGFWAVPITKLTIGDVDIPDCSDDYPCFGILDSGSTAFTAPTFIMEELAESFQPGTRISDLPSVTFTIGGVDYEIEGEEYLICEGNECCPGWTPMDFPDVNAFILGDMFLAKYFTIFDMDRQQVGLAPVVPLEGQEVFAEYDRNRRLT